jgi:hypothetical protein
MLDPALTVGDGAPGVALIPASVQGLGGDAELDDEVVTQVHRLDFAAFLPSRISAASSGVMMIRASEPPMKRRRFGRLGSVVSNPIKSPKVNSMILSIVDTLYRFLASGHENRAMACYAPVGIYSAIPLRVNDNRGPNPVG